MVASVRNTIRSSVPWRMGMRPASSLGIQVHVHELICRGFTWMSSVGDLRTRCWEGIQHRVFRLLQVWEPKYRFGFGSLCRLLPTRNTDGLLSRGAQYGDRLAYPDDAKTVSRLRTAQVFSQRGFFKQSGVREAFVYPAVD